MRRKFGPLPPSVLNWNPFSKRREIRCPDGKSRFVHKNPNDAFPFFASDYKANAEAVVKAIEGLNAQLGGEFSREVSGLFAQFDTASKSIQVLFRNIYESVYATNPCDGWSILVAETQQLIRSEDRHRQVLLEVERIRAVAQADPTDRQAIADALAEGKQHLADGDHSEQATRRMEAVERKAGEWDEVRKS